MSEMIERVARAIWEAGWHPSAPTLDDLALVDPVAHESQFAFARAAIEAMREPTPIMVQYHDHAPGIVVKIWHHMIACALSEPDTK